MGQNSIRLKVFSAAYGRHGEIEVIEWKCDVCSERAPCIYIDSSEGEYGGGAICRECIADGFVQWESAFGTEKPTFDIDETPHEWGADCFCGPKMHVDCGGYIHNQGVHGGYVQKCDKCGDFL
jgi:hypothetical protein